MKTKSDIREEGPAGGYIRYPRPGERCQLTGLAPSTLRKLIARAGGAIGIVKLGEDMGLKSRAVLINRGDLLRYLRRLEVRG